MKRSLLLIATMLLTSVTSFAQWVKPVPESQALVTDGETEQYLYNTAGGFLLGANDWNTRASVDAAKGYKVKVASTGVGTFCLIDYAETKSKWLKIFADNSTSIWVDNNSGSNCDSWQINPVDGNTFTISNAGLPEDGQLGVATDMEDTRLYLTSYFEENTIEANYVWYSVSTEAYDAYFEEITRYETAVKLGELIDEAEAAYEGIDLREAKEVYNNTSSTLEQLKAAEKLIKKAITIWKIQDGGIPLTDVQVSNPTILTEFIENHSFELGDLTGWDVDKHNVNRNEDASDMGVKENENATYTCENTDGAYLFNIWAWGNPITQTIYGLPEGVYMLNGMLSSSDDCTNQYLIAEGAILPEGDMQYKAVTLETNPGDGSKKSWLTEGTLMFVAGPNAADKGITIGAVGSAADGISYLKGGQWWYKADNFRLYYYGTTAEAYKKWVESLGLIIYNSEEEQATTALLNDYNAFVATITEAATADDAVAAYIQNRDTINALADSIKTNIATWAAYQKAVDDALTALANLDGDSEQKDVLTDYLAQNEGASEAYPNGTAEYIISQKALTTSELEAEIAFLEKLVKDAVAHTMSAGADVTSMLTNPAFKEANAAGWTHNVKASNFDGRGGLSAFPVAESWHSHFDISQTIEGVSEGLYSISLNGFCRLDDGETVVQGEVYMNDFTTPMMDIKSGAVTEEEAIDGINCYQNAGSWKNNPLLSGGTQYNGNEIDSSDGESYWPNGRTGASIAFSAGRYKATAYGLVEAGQPMTIGVRNLNSTHQWVLWSNFKLTFEGKRASAIKNVMYSFLDRLDALEDENPPFFVEWWTLFDDVHGNLEADAAELEEMSDDEDASTYYENLIEYNKILKELDANRLIVDDIIAKIHEIADLATQAVDGGDVTAEDIYARFNYTEGAEGEYLSALTIGTTSVDWIEEVFMPAYEEAKEYLNNYYAYINFIDETPLEITVADATAEGEDVTSQLQNAEITDDSGWFDGNKMGYKDGLGEMYNKPFNIYQSMQFKQTGWYVATVVAFDRRGSWDDEAKYIEAESDTCFTNMYATTCSADMETKKVVSDTLEVVPVKAGAVLGVAEALGGTTEGCRQLGELWYPNTMTSARQWFNDEEIKAATTHTIIFEVTDTETRYRVGVEKKVAPAASWFITDGMTLQYFATEEAARATGITSVEEAAAHAINGKFLINGKLVIVKDGVRYNVTGVRIK